MRNWSNRKLTLLIGGAVVLLAVAVQTLEGFTSGKTEPAVAKVYPPPRPELTREDELTIHVDLGFFHQSRFRFGDDDGTERADALFRCLQDAVERAFPAGREPFATKNEQRRAHRQMRKQMDEIQRRCADQARDLPPEPDDVDGG